MENKDPNYGVVETPEGPQLGKEGPEAPGDQAPEPGASTDTAADRERRDRAMAGAAYSDGTAAASRGQNERTWAVLGHLSMFLNLFTLFLGPVASFIVWLVYRDRSKEVSFQALQSTVYQAAWLVLLGVGWAVTGLLTFVLIGFLLIPVMAVISLVPFAHAGYAAYKVGRGEEFRYPLVADLIDGR